MPAEHGDRHTGVQSKAWEWQRLGTDEQEAWMRPSDELLPVAHRWAGRRFRRALDLGCGLGRHSLLLASLGFDVVSLDLSPQGLERLESEAKHRGLSGRIRVACHDFVDVPEDFGQFDCVLAFHAIYHTDMAGLRRAISWTTRHLKPGGGFFVTFNSKNNRSFRDAAQKKVDDNTVIKDSGQEAGIPHTYLLYEDIVQLLDGYELSAVKQIETYHGNGTSSIHFFVEAYRPLLDSSAIR